MHGSFSRHPNIHKPFMTIFQQLPVITNHSSPYSTAGIHIIVLHSVHIPTWEVTNEAPPAETSSLPPRKLKPSVSIHPGTAPRRTMTETRSFPPSDPSPSETSQGQPAHLRKPHSSNSPPSDHHHHYHHHYLAQRSAVIQLERASMLTMIHVTYTYTYNTS